MEKTTLESQKIHLKIGKFKQITYKVLLIVENNRISYISQFHPLTHMLLRMDTDDE